MRILEPQIILKRFDKPRKFSRLKFLGSRYRGAIVPRANVLADVAAEYVASHRLAKFSWNAVAQFDGQVGNTSPGVHEIGFMQRVCRTSVQAAAATAAQVRRRRTLRQRWRELQRCENHAKKEKGTQLLVQ